MKQAGIIRKIQVTEKGTALAEQNRFQLEVATWANKHEIKDAVEAQFGVHVLAVRTQNYAGKRKMTRTRHITSRPDWKRAIVTLRAGERIEAI
ncbi:MAG: 50S ribosomal protein L23 [Lentisphaerae bacterium]|jgi:large subunit ribosomal protein L23|nr:50S ribosomal protein L23 [Lentisphaerota bacterium]